MTRLHRAGRLLSAMNAIPRPADTIVTVQTINVFMDLVDLPDESDSALHPTPVGGVDFMGF